MATKKTGVDGGGARAKKDGGAAGGAAKPAARKAPARPRLRSSYANAPSAEKKAAAREGTGSTPPARRRVAKADAGVAPRPRAAAGGPTSKRTPLAGPKRAGGKKAQAALPAIEASSGARDAALAIAAIGIEKKALGIEILDVASKVDYCELLVIMTGRSDRHVHAIATGLEEGMRLRKMPAVSVEGLTAATWVLLDFGDVVVHVFQEDARRLYDIEGLWIDASRLPVPDEGREGASAD